MPSPFCSAAPIAFGYDSAVPAQQLPVYMPQRMPGYGAVVVYERVGLVCPHCKLLLRNAVQTEEGIRLCQSCFEEIAW